MLARWLASNPARRPLWPGDEGEFEDYLTALLEVGEPATLREVLRFDPHNERAISGLNRRPPAAKAETQ